MHRLMTFGIYIMLCVIALAAGLFVTQLFGITEAIPLNPNQQGPVAPITSATEAPKPPPLSPTSVPETVPSAEPPTAEPPTAAPPTAEPPTAAPPTAEPPTAAPAPGYIEYTIQKGDILNDIANRYGVTTGEILAINQITNPDSLTVGTVIRIPQK